MKYKSTNGRAELVDFKTAVIKGQAEDGGLYMPMEIPHLPEEVIFNIKSYSREDLAFYSVKPYVGGMIPDNDLKRIINETLAFETPLLKLDEEVSVLELFHGPTLAFKDVGARFLSRCLSWLSKDDDKKITVLVATSGDTGSAVADGFYGVENVQVVILYPSAKVSSIQEQQLTTYGGNIRALEVKGDFDDCQRLVKQAFADEQLRKEVALTSANSINIARWLPQQFYYFSAIQQWEGNQPPVISVPSGNFGNICAGILAWKSGLPVKHFIAACNANDVVPQFLTTGKYQPKPSVRTISNAMDVGNPSNFVRIMEIFNDKADLLSSMFSSYSFNDEQTVKAMQSLKEKYNYPSDPHGAIGYLALKEYQKQYSLPGIFFETAHPVKFPDAVPYEVIIPEKLKQLKTKEKMAKLIDADYKMLVEEIRN